MPFGVLRRAYSMNFACKMKLSWLSCYSARWAERALQRLRPLPSAKGLSELAYALMQAKLTRLAPHLSKLLRIGHRTSIRMSAAAPGNFESQTKDGWFTELSTMWLVRVCPSRSTRLFSRAAVTSRYAVLRVGGIKASCTNCIDMLESLLNSTITLKSLI